MRIGARGRGSRCRRRSCAVCIRQCPRVSQVQTVATDGRTYEFAVEDDAPEPERVRGDWVRDLSAAGTLFSGDATEDVQAVIIQKIDTDLAVAAARVRQLEAKVKELQAEVDLGVPHRSLGAPPGAIVAMARPAHAAAGGAGDAVVRPAAATVVPPPPPSGPPVGGLQLPDSVTLEPRRRADEDGTGRVRVWCGSWNMAADNAFRGMSAPAVAAALQSFMPPCHDVYALGIQECSSDESLHPIESYLQAHGILRLPLQQSSVLIPVESLGASAVVDRVSGRGDGAILDTKFTGIAIFVSMSCMHTFEARALRAAAVSFGPTQVRSHAGMHSRMRAFIRMLRLTQGSKGAAAALLSIGTKTMVFVSCHLSANNPAARRSQYSVAVEALGRLLGHSNFDLNEQFHHVFWTGDLNYRIVGVRGEEVIRLLESGKVASLHDAHDGLLLDRRDNGVYYGFEEAPKFPDFFPTYKKIPGRRPIAPPRPAAAQDLMAAAALVAPATEQPSSEARAPPPTRARSWKNLGTSPVRSRDEHAPAGASGEPPPGGVRGRRGRPARRGRDVGAMRLPHHVQGALLQGRANEVPRARVVRPRALALAARLRRRRRRGIRDAGAPARCVHAGAQLPVVQRRRCAR